ncbi:hypothetical protein GJU40_07325 [Bacillus lacus]|uniref:Uncharacterized protein n=1 Tax=Metabacillus lacus TaxID=1983721 RepID=A0A7X2IYF3_9BACI|nr:transcriptional regulator SplA domain-containing protein [Metabacillus lacus]MRX71981.1 hypothetical protein [Metabacillus lacus]
MKDEHQEEYAMNINHAELVPHPKNQDELALFLHESFHMLSAEDLQQTEG